jgi:hypothetical protein
LEAARGDLYVKDLRSGELTLREGVCHWTPEEPELYPPHVSEAARTVLIPFNDAGSTLSHGVEVLTRGTIRAVEVPGGVAARRIVLADNGRSVYFQAGSGPQGWRYDVATGATTDLLPGDPMRTEVLPDDEFREPMATSRSGRYVTYNGSRPEPALGPAGVVGVFDRTTGQSADLTGVLADLGVPRQVGTSPTVPNSTISIELSASGRVVFIHTPDGWASLAWLG